MAVVNRTVPGFIGESIYIDFDFTKRLRSGQTIDSATYSPESPITEDGGTAAVNASGTIAQARFTIPGSAVHGTWYTVECAAVCADPVETKIEYALIFAEEVPT